MNSVNILGANVHITSYEQVISKVDYWIKENYGGIIFAANVHMIMESIGSLNFRTIVNHANIVTPDGMPLVWIIRKRGFQKQARVYGPDLMIKLLSFANMHNHKIGLHGGTLKTIQILKNKIESNYPNLSISYAHSPPFRTITKEEDITIITEINDSGIKILFVGLGCPKQEKWIFEHRNKLNVVMIGVGAAFDFYSGTKPQAPKWVQEMGLEWLFRLLSEPKRLWKRYIILNIKFILQLISHHIKINKDA